MGEDYDERITRIREISDELSLHGYYIKWDGIIVFGINPSPATEKEITPGDIVQASSV
jgi:hypothetical protein